MKKLILVLFVSLFAMASMAQRGSLKTLAVDTLQGLETVNFETFNLNGSYNAVSVTALCTQLGGTSDGTLALYGSNDGTSWVFINGVGGGVITASPVASITGADLNQLTITNTLVANWVVKDTPYRRYRVTGAGTTGDTTQVNITYVYK